MKKVFSIFLVACICTILLCGCDNSTNNPAANNAGNDETQQTVSVEETGTKWETFLDEYEAFVDDYIEITNQYKANPTDLTVVNQYTEMVQKVQEWAEESDEIANELANDPVAAAEFSERVSEIVKKLESIQ